MCAHAQEDMQVIFTTFLVLWKGDIGPFSPPRHYCTNLPLTFLGIERGQFFPLPALRVCRQKREWVVMTSASLGSLALFQKPLLISCMTKTYSCVHFGKVCVWTESQPTACQTKLHMLTRALCDVWIRTTLMIPSLSLSLSIMVRKHVTESCHDARHLFLCYCVKALSSFVCGYLCKTWIKLHFGLNCRQIEPINVFHSTLITIRSVKMSKQWIDVASLYSCARAKSITSQFGSVQTWN